MNMLNLSAQFSTGDIVYKRSACFGPRIQRDLQIVYVYRGELAIFIDGVKRRVRAGEAAILLPEHEEIFQCSTRCSTRHGWVTIERPTLDPRTVESLSALPFPAPFARGMRVIAGLINPSPPASLPSPQVRSALCAALFHDFLHSAGFAGSGIATPMPEPLRKAQDYISARFATGVSLPLLASAAGVTPTHLIRIFKQHTGLTPIRHLWQHRCEAAGRLLRETGLSVSEVGFQTGFQTPYHFSRAFKRHSGATPSAYRRRLWA